MRACASRRRSLPPARASSRGFTLIEIILATMLLSLGLTIAFASLHSANASVQHADAAAARNEHLRAVQGLLYRMLQQAQPLVLSRDEHLQEVTFLEGRHDMVRFVAPMPGYLSRGGPYAITLKFAPSASGDGGLRLQFAFAMLVAEKPLEDDDKLPPEDLLDGITEGAFEYRGMGTDGKIGAWEDTWERPSELPLQVRIRLRFKDASRPWPAFATGLPLGFAQARAADTAGIAAPLQPPPPVPDGGK